VIRKISRLFVSVIILSCVLLPVGCSQNTTASSNTKVADYLTIEQAMAALQLPQAALPVVTDPVIVSLPASERKFVAIEPVKLFDDMYFVGTTSVGAFVFDTGDGFVLPLTEVEFSAV